ncbi:MAG: hypothetical protein DRJ50_12765, partial [Actinobacteria bacterium]
FTVEVRSWEPGGVVSDEALAAVISAELAGVIAPGDVWSLVSAEPGPAVGLVRVTVLISAETDGAVSDTGGDDAGSWQRSAVTMPSRGSSVTSDGR